MSKALTFIGFLILLVIGGIILFPKQKEPTAPITVTPDGGAKPSGAVIAGPSSPPGVK
jgi:hypothetical protein